MDSVEGRARDWVGARPLPRSDALESTYVGRAMDDIAKAPSRGEGRARPGGAAGLEGEVALTLG